jgi:hypothetical protein
MKRLWNLALLFAILAGQGHRASAQTAAALVNQTGGQTAAREEPLAAVAPDAPTPWLQSRNAAARPDGPPQQGTLNPGQTIPAVAPANGTHQAVQMHGRWTIDVKKPDGTISQHREFENAITASGMDYLIGLLTATYLPNEYMIALTPSSGASSMCFLALSGGSTTGPPANQCDIVASISSFSKFIFFCDGVLGNGNNHCETGLLTGFTHDSSGLFNAMVLTGTFTATLPGQVAQASTYFASCTTDPTIFNGAIQSPQNCHNIVGGGLHTGVLSQFTLQNPLQVLINDIVVVSVTITFS